MVSPRKVEGSGLLADSVWSRGLSVSFKSLSQPSQAHPDAVQPIVHTASDLHPKLLPQIPKVQCVQIHGQYVAWMISCPHDWPVPYFIEVWDWKSGMRVWVSLLDTLVQL